MNKSIKMSNNPNLIKGIFQYSISTWLSFVLGLLSVVITTRLLRPDVYGLIAIFYSASSVMLYVLTIGMDGAYIRFYNEPPGTDTGSQLLYKNIIFSTLICFIVGIVTILFFGESFSDFIFGVGSKLITGLLFLYSFTNIILRYLNISFRMSFRVFQYNFQNILMNCFSRLLVIIAAFFTDGFVWIVSILTIGLFSILIIYLFTQRKEYVPIDENGKLNSSLSLVGYSEYMKFALYSAPTYIVVYLNTYVNQQVIRTMLSSYALGIFSSTVMFGSILSAVKGGFSTFWAAYVYQNYKDDRRRIEKMHDFVVIFTIFATSILVCCRDIIYLFIGKDYHSSKLFFSLLLALPVLSFLLETTDKGIALAKKNHISFLTHSASVVLNILLCLLLIPEMGLIGAAIANSFAAVLLYVLNTYYGQKLYRTIFNVKKSIIGTFLLLGILLMPTLFFNIKAIIFLVILIDFTAFFFYKRECYVILERVKRLFIS
ncbi:hypothetical protein ETF27_06295 [Prevotella brunnea]|uniref:Uncharacterized protein n=2 Tax=Prevotella brunnea TaxID=2508867 RepID=A0A5C8GMP3_9BACT|nr:oligosaccharide flippase family protein [Prevotella brunnea]MDR0185530.1 hypothetical protein [Prevotella brunnea]TXJ62038.1 hypothetical protein ETF27_06295 [Prevotella brunnea]